MDRQTEIKISIVKPKYVGQKCPVCSGWGTVSNRRIRCKACGGTGYIKVPVEETEREKEKWNLKTN